jgi:hypothetical protein
MMDENNEELSFDMGKHNTSRHEAKDDFNKYIDKLHSGYLESKESKAVQEMRDKSKPVYYRKDIVP